MHAPSHHIRARLPVERQSLLPLDEEPCDPRFSTHQSRDVNIGVGLVRDIPSLRYGIRQRPKAVLRCSSPSHARTLKPLPCPAKDDGAVGEATDGVS